MRKGRIISGTHAEAANFLPGDKKSQLGGKVRFRERLSAALRALLELLLFLMVAASPWAFGCAEPQFEACLFFGLAGLLVLWGIRTLVEMQVRWTSCPVLYCLAALLVLGWLQLWPLPSGIMNWVSPATGKLMGRFLPTTAEVLPSAETPIPIAAPPRSTLSLYPAATRFVVMRILAVFLLFAVVRNNLSSVYTLRRLSVLALVNAVLLAILGLSQFFTSPHNTLFWTFQSAGTVFGPFINRNHFAFYINLCIGLASGLLFFVGTKRTREGFSTSSENPQKRHLDQPSYLLASQDLTDPRVLWTAAGIALLIATNAITLSRGGLLAMMLAAILIWLTNASSSRWRRLAPGVLVAAMAGALLAWFGLGAVIRRFETVFNVEAVSDSRWDLWSSAMPWVKDFFLAGTGYGT